MTAHTHRATGSIPRLPWRALASGSAVVAVGGLAARYVSARSRIERSWLADIAPKLSAIGEVDQLSILPLVERLVPSEQVLGEPGVSYLLRAGRTTLLFDAGLNLRAQAPSALVHNAEYLNIDLKRLDGIVISHLHADHVGGWRTSFRRTFALSSEVLEPRGLPAYVPTPMRHDRTDVVLTTGPLVIAPGWLSCLLSRR